MRSGFQKKLSTVAELLKNQTPEQQKQPEKKQDPSKKNASFILDRQEVFLQKMRERLQYLEDEKKKDADQKANAALRVKDLSQGKLLEKIVDFIRLLDVQMKQDFPHDYSDQLAKALPAPGRTQSLMLDWLRKIKDGSATEGHCHGLAIHWLKAMRDFNEQEFYHTITAIIGYPSSRLLELRPLITKFLVDIDRGQFSELYAHPKNMPSVTASLLNMAYIGEFDCAYYSTNQLALDLSSFFKTTRSMVVISRTKASHAIAAICRQGVFYMFDANYPEGKHKQLGRMADVAAEIRQRMTVPFNISAGARLPLSVEFYATSVPVKVPKKVSFALVGCGQFSHNKNKTSKTQADSKEKLSTQNLTAARKLG